MTVFECRLASQGARRAQAKPYGDYAPGKDNERKKGGRIPSEASLSRSREMFAEKQTRYTVTTNGRRFHSEPRRIGFKVDESGG